MTQDQLFLNMKMLGGRNMEVVIVGGRTVIKGFLPKINRKFEVRCSGFTTAGKLEDGYHKFVAMVKKVVPPPRFDPKRNCPKCKRLMKIRVNKSGERFWGCTGWRPEKPLCSNTIDIPKGTDPMEAKGE